MKKLYYSIGEVSKITNIEPYVLRYWETRFDELTPSKNRAGKRIYTEKDIDIILKLRVLIREKKFSTKGAIKALNESNTTDNGKTEQIPVSLQRDLKEIKLFLEGLLERL
ncbi:MAG TPA: MerR family transcriptional regulator [Balneolales bacterium]|nr:MerR family transcriptional regulator [Balneolales bacterium]